MDEPGASLLDALSRLGAGALGRPGAAGRSTRSNSQSSALGSQLLRRSSPMTPVRKISASDLESRTGSGYLRPMLSKTPEGCLTFLVQQPSLGSPDTSALETPASWSAQLLERGAEQLEAARAAARKSSTPGVLAQQQSLMAEAAAAAAGKQEQQQQRRQQQQPEKSEEKRSHSSEPEDSQGNEQQGRQEEQEEELGGEVKLIFELVKNICDDLDIRTLLHKILRNIAVLINADRSSLFLVRGEPGEPDRHLVSQLFNVHQESAGCECARDDADDDADCIIIPWGTGLVGYVAQSGESVNIADCYKDPRFTNAVDQRTGYVTKHMLCAPIFDKRGDIVGVAQVINKRDGNAFSRADETKFKRYLQFCGIGLRNAQSFEYCQLENRRNQVLLDLARMVFEEQFSLEEVLYRIMLHTQSLLDCQRCQVLLLESAGLSEVERLLREPAGCGSRPAASCDAPEFSRSPGARPDTCDERAPLRGAAEQDYGPQEQRQTQLQAAPDSAHEQTAQVTRAETTRERRNSLQEHAQQQQQQQQPQPQPQPKALSPKLFSLVFNLECDGAEEPVIYSSRDENKCSFKPVGATCDASQRFFPINLGITGHVAMTGETLNIADAHKDARFEPSADLGAHFKHRSILCMPIRNGRREIIGVSQLINKKNGRPFNRNDENLFEAFSIFCGLGIHNTLMYERVLKIMAKQRVTFEVLSYHATAPLEEAKKLNQLMREQVPTCFALNLSSLKFNDFSLDEQYMLKSCLRFFIDLDLMRRFRIDQLVFCNWVLSVQKNYRKVTYHPIVGGNGLTASPVRYHNWRHAFNVSQMMFAILVNTQICRDLGELETLALLIACLCHDLDHRGTNNSFQIKSASPLAQLYSTSTMEHHHFDQCVMILNSQGNQILANLTPEEYSRVILLLEEAILATDLANYFQKRDLFFKLVDSDKFDWRQDVEHRSLLRCMLMTACDVAAITKPWPVQKVVADLVMSEFYQQGDIEKNELNLKPIDLMDRSKVHELPAMQIGFIDTICAPIYTTFAKLFPHQLSPLLEGCLMNRELWHEMANSKTVPEIPKLDYIVDGICQLEVNHRAQHQQQTNNFSKSEANINS